MTLIKDKIYYSVSLETSWIVKYTEDGRECSNIRMCGDHVSFNYKAGGFWDMKEPKFNLVREATQEEAQWIEECIENRFLIKRDIIKIYELW